jgi:predicted SprT family Zn-dependent metalloprotease
MQAPLLYASTSNQAMLSGSVVGEYVSSKTQKYIINIIEKVAKTYATWSGRPLFLKTPRVLIFNTYQEKKGWAFVSYPTIAMTKFSANTLETEEWGEGFIAHEVAHYFFGDRLKPKGKEFWFLLESFAEYFSLRYLKQVNYEIFKKSILNYSEAIDKKSGSVSAILNEKRESIDEFTRYKVGPLLLLKLESKMGPSKSKSLISLLTNERNNQWTYSDFKKLILKTGFLRSDYKKFEDICLLRVPKKECFIDL